MMILTVSFSFLYDIGVCLSVWHPYLTKVYKGWHYVFALSNGIWTITHYFPFVIFQPKLLEESSSVSAQFYTIILYHSYGVHAH